MTDADLSLLGVNLAGAEFGSVGEAYGTGYTYPTHAEIDYEAAQGMNVIRLPFLWERLQPSLGGDLDPDELARIDDVVDYATSKGLEVDLDVHDYGNFNGQPIGSAAVPNSAFTDLWSRIASHFASNPKVMFGLMNEPQQSDAGAWLGIVNGAIAAIRQTGADQEILVPGIGYDGAWTWTTGPNASVVGNGVVDPANNYAFEVHQYLDSDGSGTHAAAVSPTIGAERLSAITSWAESTGHRLFLGEFGASDDPTSLAALGNMLGYMSQHADVWQGGTYWAAGPWWGDYMYSAEPSNGTDAPQMKVLETYAPGTTPTTSGAVSGTTSSAAPTTTTGSSSATSTPQTTGGPSSTASSPAPATSSEAASAGDGAASTSSQPPATIPAQSAPTIPSSQSDNAATTVSPSAASDVDPSTVAGSSPSEATPSSDAPNAAAAAGIVAPLASATSGQAAASAPTASFAYGIAVLGRTRVTLTGSVSDPSATVVVYAGSRDLGSATVATDGSWSLSTTLTGRIPVLSLQASDVDGTSTASAPFSLVAGIRRRPYGVAFLGQAADGTSATTTQFGPHGGTFMSWTTTPDAGGGLTDVYAESPGLRRKGLSALTVVSDADGSIVSRDATVLAGGVRDLAATDAVDRFVFQPGVGQDTVAGFTTGGAAHDVLVLPRSEFSSFADVLAATAQNGSDAVISAAQGSITLAGVALSSLRPQDVRFHS